MSSGVAVVVLVSVEDTPDEILQQMRSRSMMMLIRLRWNL
jgi:hypothetical protein